MTYSFRKAPQELQVKTWLKRVKHCLRDGENEITAYKLDKLFSQTSWTRKECEQGLPSAITPKHISGRFKLIEREWTHIKLNKSTPKTDKDYDLPSRVNLHPLCHGTYDLYTSSFWDLLQAQPLDIDANAAVLDKALTRLKIERLCGAEAMQLGLGKGSVLVQITPESGNKIQTISLNESKAIELVHTKKVDISSSIANTLEASLKSIQGDIFDVLALYGSLYREAFHNFDATKITILQTLINKTFNKLIWLTWVDELRVPLVDIYKQRVINGIGDFEPASNDQPLLITDSMANRFNFFVQDSSVETDQSQFRTPTKNWWED